MDQKIGCITGGGKSRCKVESLISIDERGQMALPKDLREKAGDFKASLFGALESYQKP